MAEIFLESDDFMHAILDELALSCDELLPLLGGLVEEAGVDLCLLVLQGHFTSEDVALLQTLGHVGVTTAVVHHQT